MSIDQRRITSGKQKLPIKALFYGPGGVGKTTAAGAAPDPFFCDADRGSHHLGHVRRFVPEKWSEVLECGDDVESGRIRCGTYVFDSATNAEAMSHTDFFAGESAATWKGGYGKGGWHALSMWRPVIAQLERIWRKGTNVVIIAHSKVKGFDDPLASDGYDRFEIFLEEKLAGALFQWVDYGFFCREDIIIDPTTSRPKASSTPYFFTRRSPAYEAKARGSALFPEKIPLGWGAFTQAIDEDNARLSAMPGEIDHMLLEIDDATFAKSVREWLSKNPTRIIEMHTRVRSKLEEARAKVSAAAPLLPENATPNGA